MEGRFRLPGRGSVWPYVAVLMLLPAAVLWRQTNPLFPPPGGIDTWIYFGFFRNLVEFKRELFFGTYYGSRLSWLLPGAAFHALLPPLAAEALLHLTVYWTATLSLFFTLRATCGRRAAFLTALLFGVHPQLWEAAGWDYVDGAGIAWCLLTFALLTRAAEREAPRGALLAAGMTLAAMVYTNLFWMALAPLAPLSYLAKTGVTRVRGLAVWFGGGCVLATALLGAVNYALDGHFWFYAKSVLVALHLTAAPNPWFTGIWTAHGLVRWLWWPAGATAVAAVALARTGMPRWFGAQWLAALAIAGLFQLRGTPVLGLPHYASYLLPFAFLALGAVWTAADRLSPPAWRLCCGALVLAAALIWGDFRGRFTPMWPAAAAPVAALASVLLAAALLAHRRAASVPMALAAGLVVIAETRMGYVADGHTFRHHFERVAAARADVEAARRGEPVRFWYDGRDPAAPDYLALSSTYLWSNTLYGASFPEGACAEDVEPGTVLVAMSRRDDTAALAEASLADCWSRRGLRPEVALTRVGSGYTIALVRAVPGGSPRRALTAGMSGIDGVRLLPTAEAAAALPLNGWRGLNGGTISAGRAATCPLVAGAPGTYRFTLAVSAIDGDFAFGAAAPGHAELAVEAPPGHTQGERLQRTFWMDLHAGEPIELRLVNRRADGQPVRFRLHGVSGLAVLR